MVAKRTVRVLLTVLVAFAVVTSVIAVPVSAGDDSVLEEDDDDDPVGVSANNDSVSVNAGDDSVTVDSGGVSADTDDTTDAVSSGDEASTDDASTTTPPAEITDHNPVNYSDVPFWIVPVNLCRGAPEAPDGLELPVENPTPVDPTDPPGAPFTQCDIFNPYEPPFDPTDLPDDPQYDYDIRPEVSEDGVYVGGGGQASPDSEWPGVDTVGGVRVSQKGVTVIQLTTVDGGNRNSKAFSDARLYPGARTAELRGWSVVIDRKADASLLCNGEVCVASGPGPAPSQEVPTNRSSDGGGDSPTVPCESPVGSEDIPELPVNLPNPSDASITPCDVYDPNRPPNVSTSPEYNVYESEVGTDAVVGGVAATLGGSNSPNVNAITGVSRDQKEVRAAQSTYLHDGQKSYVFSASANADPRSATDAGLEGVNFYSDSGIGAHAFGEYAAVTVSCDGEFCTLDSQNAPGDGYQIRISNGSDSDSGDEQTTSSSTDDSSSTESDDGEITQSSQSSASSSSSGSTTSGGSSADSSTASVSSPSDTTTMAAADDLPRAVNSGTTGIPSAFQNGLPDAASASEALMALI